MQISLSDKKKTHRGEARVKRMDEQITEKDKASILARKEKKKTTVLGFWLG